MSSDFDRPDWTPEQALRFYANQKNFDIVDGHARILDNGAIASNALKHHSLAHLEMKGDAELTGLRAEVARLTAENERLSTLADRWNTEGDELREDNKRLSAEAESATLRAENEMIAKNDAQAEVRRLTAELDELRAQEPVGEVDTYHKHVYFQVPWESLPNHSKVFARPVPAAQVLTEDDIRRAIFGNSHPADGWYVAFLAADEVDTVCRQILAKANGGAKAMLAECTNERTVTHLAGDGTPVEFCPNCGKNEPETVARWNGCAA